jgi:hypothetical protein
MVFRYLYSTAINHVPSYLFHITRINVELIWKLVSGGCKARMKDIVREWGLMKKLCGMAQKA